jgi:hypothetical protein
MDLTNDINAAIAGHLPAAVGEVLRKRLQQVDQLEKDAEALRKRLEATEQALSVALAKVAAAGAVDARLAKADAHEKELADAAAAMSLREAVIILREAHARERVDDMRSLTQAVFANNHYKYQVQSQVMTATPTPGQAYPTISTLNHAHAVEGQQ